MNSQQLIADLTEDVSAGKAGRVIVGLNWTLVEGPEGIGLAQTPERGAAGCVPMAEAGSLAGRSLVDLAALAGSDNPIQSAIGFAAINAHYNRFDFGGAAINGLDALAGVKGPITAIGRFPGLAERLPGVRIIERSPRPGEYSEADAERLLGESEAAFITASALTNGTLTGLLAAARHCRVVLVGPSAPLAPCLIDRGIEVIAGLVVRDVESVEAAVVEGGAVRALKSHCRFVSLVAPGHH
ncbi:MAG: Rossmann-like domain-containing protein [Sphingomonadales bacterium]